MQKHKNDLASVTERIEQPILPGNTAIFGKNMEKNFLMHPPTDKNQLKKNLKTSFFFQKNRKVIALVIESLDYMSLP